MVQLSHPYMNTGKTIALTRWTFVVKVTSLLFNMLSRLVIAFLPRNKHLLISWLQSLSAEILESKKIKSPTVSIVSPFIYHEVMGGHDLCFFNDEFLASFLVAQLVKNLSAVQETPVQSLGWEDPLEKGMATHSSILAWWVQRTVQSMGSQRVRHDFHFHQWD